MGGGDGVLLRRFAYEYGSNPLHLLAALAAIVVAAWALSQALGQLEPPGKFVLWFLGAILLHDLLFLPFYAVLGRLAARAFVRGETSSRLRVAALNHLRVPVILSALAFLVWYPNILAKSESGFEGATGLTKDVYLGRWLLLTAVLFAGSALLLALRARRLRGAG